MLVPRPLTLRKSTLPLIPISGMYVPYKDLLFPDHELISESEVPAMSGRKRIVGVESIARCQMETTDSVQWKGNRGIAHKIGPLKPLNPDDEDVREGKKSAKKKATTKATKLTAMKKKKNPSGRSRMVKVFPAGDESNYDFSDIDGDCSTLAPTRAKPTAKRQAVFAARSKLGVEDNGSDSESFSDSVVKTRLQSKDDEFLTAMRRKVTLLQKTP